MPLTGVEKSNDKGFRLSFHLFHFLQGRWFYALLVCLEKPLLPETTSLLRTLARLSATLRASLVCFSHFFIYFPSMKQLALGLDCSPCMGACAPLTVPKHESTVFAVKKNYRYARNVCHFLQDHTDSFLPYKFPMYTFFYIFINVTRSPSTGENNLFCFIFPKHLP